MEKLKELPFTELQAIREYFAFQISQFDPEKRIVKNKPAAYTKEYLDDWHQTICDIIQNKFEDLTTL